MRKYLFYIFSCFVCFGFLSACRKSDEPKSNIKDPRVNFEALWHIMDQHYCFFDLKLKPLHKTWQQVHDEYTTKITPQMSEDSLFDTLSQMLSILKDGHVNLVSSFDYGRYWGWKDDYPSNYNNDIASKYLTTGDHDYRIAGGMYYRQIEYNNHKTDSIGYIRYPSFESNLNETSLNAVLLHLRKCKGIIFDIRNNGGGLISSSDLIASHLYNKQIAGNGRLVGFITHKVSPKHDDFSIPLPIYVKVANNGVLWNRPFIVLTNRGVFSAANDFVMKVKGLPWVKIIGDKTGGGGGLPMSSELPNGWRIRYSASRVTDISDRDIEFGIEPDISLSLYKSDIDKGLDTYIEQAVLIIKKMCKGHCSSTK